MHKLSNNYIVKLQHLNLYVLLAFSDSDPDPAPDPDPNNFFGRSRIRIKTFRIRHTGFNPLNRRESIFQENVSLFIKIKYSL